MHLPEIAVGAIFNLILLGTAIGPLIGGRLSDRLGRLPMLWVVYGPSIPIILVFGLSDSFPLWTTAALGLPVERIASWRIR